MSQFIEVIEKAHATQNHTPRMLNVEYVAHIEFDDREDATIFTMSDGTRVRCDGDQTQLVRDVCAIPQEGQPE